MLSYQRSTALDQRIGSIRKTMREIFGIARLRAGSGRHHP
jgi:hypothetical protein